VRAAISFGTPNRWVTDAYISSSHGNRFFQQASQRHRISGYEHPKPPASCSAVIWSVKSRHMAVCGNLEQGTETRSASHLSRIADDHFDIQRGRAGSGSRRCSGWQSRSTKERLWAFDFDRRIAIVIALGTGRRFRPGRDALATSRPVTIADSSSEVQQRFKPALTDLGLVGRVGGVHARFSKCLRWIAGGVKCRDSPCPISEVSTFVLVPATTRCIPTDFAL